MPTSPGSVPNSDQAKERPRVTAEPAHAIFIVVLALNVTLLGARGSVFGARPAFALTRFGAAGALVVAVLGAQIPVAAQTPSPSDRMLRVKDGDVRLDPAAPRPGEPATVTVRIRNVGGAPVRVKIEVLARAACADLVGSLTGFEGLNIAAGETVTWKGQFAGPQWARWYMGVEVRLMDVNRKEPYVASQDVWKRVGRGRFEKCTAG